MPQIIDLFAGVGGLSLGAARAGFEVALAVELDKHAIAAHSRNFPHTQHLAEDVNLLTGETLLRYSGIEPGTLDGLIGGPPCQGFNAIGVRNAVDPRNNLFGRFFELVAETQPKFFVAENVPGILEGRYNQIREAAFAYVAEEYTLLAPIRIKATDYGASTSRERVFFIGYLADEMDAVAEVDFERRRVGTAPTVTEALQGLPVIIDSEWQSEEDSWRTVVLPTDGIPSPWGNHIPTNVGDAESLHRYQEASVVSGCFGTRHSPEVERRYAELLPGQRDNTSKAPRLNPNGFCPTLRAGTGPDKGSYQAVRPIHPTEPRVITPREAARLQGFPDWFRFDPTKWHSFRQIGNSVSPIVAEAVLEVMRTKLMQ